MIRIGYQGIQRSNSEEATMQLVKKHDFDKVLCRRNAGEFNNLFLMKSNLEDSNDNTKNFEIY